MFDLVIFDCDGVLVDSEALVADIYSKFFKEHDVEISALELGERYAGKTDFNLMQDIQERFKVTLPKDAQTQIGLLAKAKMETDLEAITGVKELLGQLRYDKCVCSNSGYKRLMQSLDVTGIIQHFEIDHIFSSNFVENPKPAPDLHEFAAAQFSVSPNRCLVIEDSVTGVLAAKSAGMEVYGFTGAGHSSENQPRLLTEAGASMIFETMEQLHGHLI